jgi:hypothetical protein
VVFSHILPARWTKKKGFTNGVLNGEVDPDSPFSSCLFLGENISWTVIPFARLALERPIHEEVIHPRPGPSFPGTFKAVKLRPNRGKASSTIVQWMPFVKGRSVPLIHHQGIISPQGTGFRRLKRRWLQSILDFTA